jgi:hypothetical protein
MKTYEVLYDWDCYPVRIPRSFESRQEAGDFYDQKEREGRNPELFIRTKNEEQLQEVNQIHPNIGNLLKIHPLPWQATADNKGDACVKDANGTIILYPQGDCCFQLVALIAAVFTYPPFEGRTSIGDQSCCT